MRPSSLIGWLLAGAATFLLGGAWLWIYQNPWPIRTGTGDPFADADHLGNWLVFIGIFVGYVTFVINSFQQTKLTALQNTLSALQNLRTDKDYINHAKTFKERVGRLDRPISDELLAVLKRVDEGGPVSALDIDQATKDLEFAEAVDFIINQYEFIAAGVSLRIMDERYLFVTIRSTILILGTVLESYISQQRSGNSERWENLVLLHNRFAKDTPSAQRDLGPPPGR